MAMANGKLMGVNRLAKAILGNIDFFGNKRRPIDCEEI
jgi:hypothetical protein